MTSVRSASNTSPTTPSDSGTSSSFFSVATGYRLFTSSSKNQPDPDQDHLVWNETEQYSAVISRKEHRRDPTSLLSIRDVLRQKTIPEQSNGPASGSRFLNMAAIPNGAPTAAKAKADVALNKEPAGGLLNSSDKVEGADKLLHELDEATPTTSRPASIRSEAISSTSSGLVDAHIRRGKASSIVSVESEDSQATIGKDDESESKKAEPTAEPTPRPSVLPPPLPPKDDLPLTKEASTTIAPSEKIASPSDPTPSSPPPTSSGFATALATGINSAMRFVLSGEPPSTPAPSNARKHHLLSVEMSNIDERPHIKYDWTIGKRIKFSCTVYYAKQFDLLRKRCGINDTFLKSLSRSTNWSAEGGKSKSNFWKTSDDRFIIKTLVNAWNVADL